MQTRMNGRGHTGELRVLIRMEQDSQPQLAIVPGLPDQACLIEQFSGAAGPSASCARHRNRSAKALASTIPKILSYRASFHCRMNIAHQTSRSNIAGCKDCACWKLAGSSLLKTTTRQKSVMCEGYLDRRPPGVVVCRSGMSAFACSRQQ